jgi:hypothetical protein
MSAIIILHYFDGTPSVCGDKLEPPFITLLTIPFIGSLPKYTLTSGAG